jgi:CheY-like chemotaxis protein
VGRIAVVNDDLTFLELVSELLEERGWETVMLHEGNTAFVKIKQEQPSLVILDIRMEQPDTGWRVLNLLMLDPETRAIPVIMCSADWTELDQKREWLNERGVQVLPRPFEVEDLYDSIEKALADERLRLA